MVNSYCWIRMAEGLVDGSEVVGSCLGLGCWEMVC
jgi:hypothetical protein